VRSFFSPLVLALAVALLCGCGPDRFAARANANNSTSSIAARATEPRTDDATASNANGMLPVTASPTRGPSPSGPGSTVSGGPKTASSQSAGTESPTGAGTTTTKTADAPKKIGARHVLIQWMGSERAPTAVVRSRDQARAVAEEVLRRARAGDDFARLAIEFSDEPGAGGRGGSLGRFGHGQMVPAFEAAAFKLEIGQISEIVESPFGFHVIQRTE
jgi:NIMA-interacting peptidyl-prolyl cis-trans isomerase 1